MTSPYLVHSTIAPIIGTVLNGQTKVLHLNHLWRNNNVVNMANMNMPLKRVVSLFLTNLHQRLTVRSTKVSWMDHDVLTRKRLARKWPGRAGRAANPPCDKNACRSFANMVNEAANARIWENWLAYDDCQLMLFDQQSLDLVKMSYQSLIMTHSNMPSYPMPVHCINAVKNLPESHYHYQWAEWPHPIVTTIGHGDSARGR